MCGARPIIAERWEYVCIYTGSIKFPDVLATRRISVARKCPTRCRSQGRRRSPFRSPRAFRVNRKGGHPGEKGGALYKRGPQGNQPLGGVTNPRLYIYILRAGFPGRRGRCTIEPRGSLGFFISKKKKKNLSANLSRFLIVRPLNEL